jgi:hypothetical protein
MNLASLWAATFAVEGALFVVLGIVRQDLVIRPSRDVASVIGGVFIVYAIVAYVILGLLGGHRFGTLPTPGLAPCPSVTFCFGLLLWAKPPVPLALLPLPLAWALTAAPPDLATGVVADIGMLIAGVTAAVMILWRGRTSRHTVVAGLLLAVAIAWSGHDNVLIGLATLLMIAVLTREFRPHPPRSSTSLLPTAPSPTSRSTTPQSMPNAG